MSSKIDILTCRNYEKRPWFDLVYEWEDDLKFLFNCKFIYEPTIFKNRYYQFLPLVYHCILMIKNRRKPILFLEMKANLFHLQKNLKYLIPWIIDWYVSPKNQWLYNMLYRRHKLILVSSKEVYDYLLARGTRLNIRHLALSLSDRYKITSNTCYEKKYDIILIGRQNPILKEFLEQYKELNPELIIFIPSKQELSSRGGYLDSMRKSRIALYATPGIDGGEKRTNGFSQVTPRFLEMVASGCNIIARYKTNADTDYYEMGKFCQSIDTYEEFEKEMDRCRTKEPDMAFYSEYLQKHYTSARAKELQTIINGVDW